MLEFGTDGVRGRANQELTPEFALSFGRALAAVFRPEVVVIGRDTRISGPMLSNALASGLSSSGVSVLDLGVIPTPGVAYVCAQRSCVGVVISASHNPYYDNGIKVFAPGGIKLEDELESRIHSYVLSGNLQAVGDVGEVALDLSARDDYAAFLRSQCNLDSGNPLKVVVDCSNGAAASVAPGLFSALNLDVSFLAIAPDGLNINDGCGSVHPELLIEEVLHRRADLGIALDGDADRMLAVDGVGNLVDGDELLAMFALDLKSRGNLEKNSVVVTVMTNLGFRQAMSRNGIAVHETQVGDRYVLQTLEQHGLSLGGEQSGHIIFRDIATTGDGLLSAVKLIELINRSKVSLAEHAHKSMTKLPQALVSLDFEDPKRIDAMSELWELVVEMEKSLGDSGRILVRASGTEPKVRIMAEATTRDAASQVVEKICEFLRSAG